MEDLFFIVSKLFWFFVQPGNLLAIIVLVVAAAGVFSRRYRLLKFLNACLFILVLALSVLPVSNWLSRPLEGRFPAITIADIPTDITGIVVLGGILDPVVTARTGVPSIGGGAERFTEMIHLGNAFPDVPVVFSGGSGQITDTQYREGHAAKALVERLGLVVDRYTYESEARNTFENAMNVARLHPPGPGNRWVVVTSASHMPRSVGVFRKAGFNVVPYPVDYKLNKESVPLFGFNLAGNLLGMSSATKEWIGLIYYRIMGRSDDLFPGPNSISG